ncbi:tripartite tricarboxylate transporter substrate binding protein [Alcaligenaceae bacterium LF4-65]|uniref:Tripartite tricarboxylate transporter substrate binding protein n=1 Tax=Zwartia hollandica TaxID=324606 RepID=A0A953T842_9BURK|nr:tripartite tricarboxylate transporter substrate binding protein [Zwartia hollandica]MBZ1351349.1 tripartite tricarboxylate transporter substrate binding protein [Zwartia hollandica]
MFSMEMKVRSLSVILGMATLASVLASTPAVAQSDFPLRPIKIIVGFAPGGPTDVQARLLASKLSPILNQAVVIENKPGASTTIALAEVARATPDGYTLSFGGSGAFATTPVTMASIPYNPKTAFEPIAITGEEQIAFAVNPSLPAKTLAEFVALAKQNPGKYSFGSSGQGNITHLTGELLKLRAGDLKIEHIAYKGAAPALNDVLAGHVQMMVGGLGSVYPMHQSGKLRVLAITSKDRVSYAKDIPTAGEAGVKDLIAGSTFVLLAPAKTPKNVIQKLNQAVNEALKEASYQQDMRAAYVEPILGSTPASTQQLLDTELALWKNLVEKSNLKF